MPRRTVRFAVKTKDGGECLLFSIVERANGDLIIPIPGGDTSLNEWDKGASISETRCSIHQSLRSPTYTTIKLTSTSDKKVTTQVALTDAVKTKSGFSPVFFRRCQNPEISSLNPVASRPRDETLTLPEFEPEKFTLFYGIFVGHRDAAFIAGHDDVNIAKFRFGQFQLVVMVSLGKFPSYVTTEVLSPVTTPPETNPSVEEVLRFLMTGRPPAVCIRQYKAAVNALGKKFLEEMRKLTEATTLEHLDREIEALASSNLGSIKLKTRSQSLHVLSDAQLPIAALPEWQRIRRLLEEALES
jgi:hypothetical protein